MSVFIEKHCDYMMPCGWCELREMMCPTIVPIGPSVYPKDATWAWGGTTTNPMDITTTYTTGKMDGGEE